MLFSIDPTIQIAQKSSQLILGHLINQILMKLVAEIENLIALVFLFSFVQSSIVICLTSLQIPYEISTKWFRCHVFLEIEQ